MGRYGVEISQQGIPVDRAADYQKVLDSNWKFIDIIVDEDIELTVVGTSFDPVLTKIVDHGLGYTPGFEFLVASSSKIPFGSTPGAIHGQIYADSKSIYLLTNSTGEYVAAGRLRVFTLNIMDEYSAPSYGNSSSGPSGIGRYGAKFVDLNKGSNDIDDNRMTSFTLNTQGKQMSVHKHGTAVADVASGTLTIAHNVGYPPTYMLCTITEKAAVAYNWPFLTDMVANGLVSAFYSAKADTVNIEFKGVQSALFGRYGYVILKDPAEIAG